MSEAPPEAYDTFALNAMSNRNFDLAVEMYSKAIEKDPNNGLYYAHRCAAYLAKNDMEKAEEDRKKAEELAGDNPEVYASLGCVYEYLEDWKKSVECYEKALELKPGSENVWALMRHSKARMGEKKFQLAFIEFIDKQGPDAAPILKSPQLYHFIDDITEDRHNCMKYLNDPPMMLFALYRLSSSDDSQPVPENDREINRKDSKKDIKKEESSKKEENSKIEKSNTKETKECIIF